jgi:lipoyl(octanoyl) transferase
MLQQVSWEDLGYRRYQPVWDYQEALLKQNVDIKSAQRNGDYRADTRHRLLLVEHPPVYTLGKSGKVEHILISEQDMRERGIDYFHINRGGDITFHGPQQLVGYPILDLEKFRTDLGWYLRSLEEVIIRIMADYGLKGDRSAGETGVWLDPDQPAKARKICAMGIKCSRWITMHGFAFNVNTDLDYFRHIVPCGIHDKQVTSLQQELGREITMDEIKTKFLHYFAEVFDVVLTEEPASMLAAD